MGRVSVREYSEISSIYCDLAEECVSALRQFYYDIEENCRRCTYKPMVDFTNQVCQFYYGDFRSHLMREFGNWESSEYSLDNLARRIGAGEDAAAVGKQHMERIRSSLEELFSGAALEEIHIDTSAPDINNETIQRNNEYINTFIRTAESAEDSAVSRTESAASENDAFYCIVGIVKTTGNSLVESFREMLTQVDKGNELYSTGNRSSVNPAMSDRGNAVDAGGTMNWPFSGDFL